MITSIFNIAITNFSKFPIFVLNNLKIRIILHIIKTDLFKVEPFMQIQQQQHGGDRNVTGNSISANSLPSSPKYPIRIFRKTKMPMARNLKNKQSRVQTLYEYV